MLFAGGTVSAQLRENADRISSPTVLSFAEDSEGYIWIGTDHGLNRFNGTDYLTFFASSLPNSLCSDYICDLCYDGDGRLWIGTTLGICVYEDAVFRHKEKYGLDVIVNITDMDRDYLLTSSFIGLSKIRKDDLATVSVFTEPDFYNVRATAFTEEREVWAVTPDVTAPILFILDSDLHLLDRLRLEDASSIFDCVVTENHLVWLASASKVLCFNSATHDPVDVPELSAFLQGRELRLMSVYGPGKLLLGIGGEGLFLYDYYSGTFSRIFPEEHVESRNYLAFTDSNANIWLSDGLGDWHVCLEGNSLSKASRFMESMKVPSVTSLAISGEGVLWATSRGDLVAIDLSDGRVLYHESDKVYGFLTTDSQGAVWVCVDNNVAVIRKSGDSYRLESLGLPFRSNVRVVCEDGAGDMWVLQKGGVARLQEGRIVQEVALSEDMAPFNLIRCGNSGEMFLFTMEGLYRFGQDRQFVPFLHGRINSPSSIARDLEGDYWIGTSIGLYRYDAVTDALTLYDSEDGLTDNTVQSVSLASDGNIWFSTLTDIGRFDREKEVFSFYEDKRFSDPSLYIMNCEVSTLDGRLCFANRDGVTVVDPQLVRNLPERQISLYRLAVNGSELYMPSERIVLDHERNNLNFWCNCFDFVTGSNILYRYKLDGYDREWSSSTVSSRRAYQGLKPGRYVFRARVMNPDGTWSGSEVAQPVVIRPVWYLSVFFKILYLLLGFALATVAYYLLQRHRQQQEAYNRSEQKRLLDRQHLDFLTNVSHELRTPLTLIYAPVQELLKESKSHLDRHEAELLTVVDHNVSRLRTLTEQLLDSGALSRDESSLSISLYNLSYMLKMLADNFRFMAIDKGISMECDVPADVEGWVDFDKVEKIVGNLVSNAIKYTSEGGTVRIGLLALPDEGRVRIAVRDNGRGIPENKRDDLFTRFDRLGAERTDPETPGSGIGLNYSYWLAQIHRGTLEYAPEEPCGSCFTLTIPVVKAAYADDEIQTRKWTFPMQQTYRESDPSDDGKDRLVLIVEDDLEILSYMERLFSTEWNVVTARDGGEASDALTQIIPDLVVSDVVMPHKDGYTLCEEIKASDDTCHIPVILLTAKSDTASSILGLSKGADAYISKPFDPYYLLAEATTLMLNHRRIQERVLNYTSSSLKEDGSAVTEDVLSEEDRAFLDRVHTAMDTNLSVESFNVNALAQELELSYNNLYLRIKALTGQTPQVYLNTYKMNVAMELLKAGRLNVSEVSYAVGASSVSNFSRSFKKHFGFPPSGV